MRLSRLLGIKSRKIKRTSKMTELGGPSIVETHLNRLSPLGPALQLGGRIQGYGTQLLLYPMAEVVRALDILGAPLFSFLPFSGVSAASNILNKNFLGKV